MQLSDESKGPEGCSIAPVCNTDFLIKIHTTHTPENCIAMLKAPA